MSDTAELLRRAAVNMRERAAAMQPGPWRVLHIDPAVVPDKDGEHSWFVMGSSHGPYADCDWPIAAEHIASWHPVVALAVADWLDSAAKFEETQYGDGSPEALAVARAYLGEASSVRHTSAARSRIRRQVSST